MSDAHNTVELLERAQADVQNLTGEDRYLWTAATERLHANAAPTFEIADTDIASIDPASPIQCYTNIGGSRVIVVEYKRGGSVVKVIQVRFYDNHQDRPTR